MNLYLNDNKNYKIILNKKEYKIASYKEIVNASILPVLNFLHCLQYTSGIREITRYLCALTKDTREGTIHISREWNRYYNTINSAEVLKSKLEKVDIDEDSKRNYPFVG